ncbi:cupin domain-containing protein [Kistimonas asteriae]|uniref:cupin domain-containing protein n=1 Tax=Kistimonas asteriae TaxID=517724 RepID=UPI001BAE3927|nr:cupin domain-containing protein [Kistimonas asteriae]
MNRPHFPVLAHLSANEFLDQYWQKQPLLIKHALPDWTLPLSPDELAGLACEESVESRLLLRQLGDQEWVLKRGPFNEQDFTDLPPDNWTLLVQAVDHWVPEVRELLNEFRFIPDWRLDDIMISYATEGGGVGPHFDNYDVFLIQASGTRHWQSGQLCDDRSPLLPHPDLKILAEFKTDQDFHMEPGDMLYLPPGVAHWGTATSNDCVTVSVGFRAPSHGEVVSDYGLWLNDHLSDFLRYADPDLKAPSHPAEISAEAITRVQEILKQYANDPEQVARWFGRLMTEPKYPENAMADLEPVTAEMSVADDARLAWYQSEDLDTVYLFANGQDYALPASLKTTVVAVCDNRYVSASHMENLSASERESLTALLTDLVENGVLMTAE